MFIASDINQFYDQSHILWNLNIVAPKGKCTCIMGRNGVGKTTLLKCIMGLLPIRSGELQFNRQSLNKKNVEYRAKAGIGYVPQGRDIFGQLTVEENLKVAGQVKRRFNRQALNRIFHLFPVLKEMLNRKGGDLSGGQQQQLAIARALLLEPTLLILDEPCEGIQPNIVSQIGDVITRLKEEEAMTLLIVEQKLPFAKKVADNFIIMEKGRNVAEGSLNELTDELVNRHLKV